MSVRVVQGSVQVEQKQETVRESVKKVSVDVVMTVSTLVTVTREGRFEGTCAEASVRRGSLRMLA